MAVKKVTALECALNSGQGKLAEMLIRAGARSSGEVAPAAGGDAEKKGGKKQRKKQMDKATQSLLEDGVDSDQGGATKEVSLPDDDLFNFDVARNRRRKRRRRRTRKKQNQNRRCVQMS